MDLNVYLAPLRKWWGLLVIASLVAAVSSYIVTRQQPPVYQARTTLVIGRSVFIPNPTGSDFWLGQQLATFYADYATREPVRNATMNGLGLNWLPEYYAAAVPNSQLIEIVVTDTSPERAQAVANELAIQLIRQSPTSRESQALEHQEFVQQQLYNLETEINQTMDEMAAKQEELGELFSARQIADAEADMAALETKLTTLQTNYAALLANSEQGASNTLSVIESASLPRRQIGPQTQMIVLLTTAIGLFLAAVAAYLIEYMDDTLKTTDDITKVVNVPVIGTIAEVKKEEAGGAFVARQPRSLVADAYRSLRTNLEFASVDKPLRTVFVTSSGISEGKTSIAINLAVVMAQGGKRVVLLDADLRRPNVDRCLGITNQVGLSDLFRGQVEIEDAFTPWDVPDVRVIVSGDLPPNPADLLGSKKMDAILEELQREADIVIVDGPPFLVADASVLANKVDGVLVVVRHGVSRRDGLKTAFEKLHQAGANVLGVVMNRVPRSSSLYGSYHYEAYYTGMEGKSRHEGNEGAGDHSKPRSGIARRLSGRSGKARFSLPKFGAGARPGETAAPVIDMQANGNGARPAPYEPVQPEPEVYEQILPAEAVGEAVEMPVEAEEPVQELGGLVPGVSTEQPTRETSDAEQVEPEPGQASALPRHSSRGSRKG